MATVDTMLHNAELDELFPPRGPCGLCGHPDARHRIWDMILDSPESDRDAADEYGVSVAAVEAVRRIRPYREQPAEGGKHGE